MTEYNTLRVDEIMDEQKQHPADEVTNGTQRRGRPVTHKTFERLRQISEEIMQSRNGKPFEDSTEIIRQMREERTKELTQAVTCQYDEDEEDTSEEHFMQFIVHPEIFERFPGIHLPVAVVYDIDNQIDRPQITARWQETWEAVGKAAAYGNAQSHPSVQLWRERFRAQGISGKEFPSSIEALLRRALKGNIPFHINPLVDFYNTISLQYVVPAGAFDLDSLHGPLELRLTRDGDTFMALDEDLPQAVPPGEIAYANGQTILTRHFVWRQAKTCLITRSTRSVFLVSEVLGDLGSEVAEKVLNELSAGLQNTLM